MLSKWSVFLRGCVNTPLTYPFHKLRRSRAKTEFSSEQQILDVFVSQKGEQ